MDDSVIMCDEIIESCDEDTEANLYEKQILMKRKQSIKQN